eukprot:TRINITY_DN29586_c0_g1_i1.p2 TRINITY_DN29586_c0_g1~~TRINITY_DN29586_c0_g1_i1.p2  ORF type:complete len:116 (-),score=22.05 TRINITY_DN29586_c0_g1_i1:261-608(-)
MLAYFLTVSFLPFFSMGGSAAGPSAWADPAREARRAAAPKATMDRRATAVSSDETEHRTGETDTMRTDERAGACREAEAWNAEFTEASWDTVVQATEAMAVKKLADTTVGWKLMS